MNRLSTMAAPVLWICALIVTIDFTSAAKVVFSPQNINSHVGYHARLAYALAKEGHTVGFILPNNTKAPSLIRDSSVEIIWYPVKDEIPIVSTEEGSRLVIESTLAKSIVEQFQLQGKMFEKFKTSWDEECHSMLNDEGVRNHMDRMQYDIAIVDNADIACRSVLPYSRNIPMIIYGVLSLEWIFRVPTLPSIVPPMIGSGRVDLSFLQRLQDTLTYILGHVLITNMDPNIKPGPTPPMSTEEILKNAAFYFILDDASIALPRPLMPNMAYIGDLIPQPGQPLSAEVATFVESATHGVVIASFGSFFDFLPADVCDKFCGAFQQIPQKVIWKLKNRKMCNVNPEKVMIMDWMPQNDLLAHNNVKLFVSHCGRNSVLESIYHATPVLCFPLSIDQPFNAMLVENLGLGDQMKVTDFTTSSLIDSISDIIQNGTTQETVSRASAIMRNQRESPEKRVSYWVNHLVQHGDKHLKTKAFELNLIQFYCIDVLFVVFLSISFIVALCYYCVKYCFRCLRYKCFSKKLKSD